MTLGTLPMYTTDMDKSRLEAFSDGVFSIVMTLLVLDIKLPVLVEPVTDAELWRGVQYTLPHVYIFMATFAVLSVAWTNHHFLFHGFAKVVDRWLNLINLLYLMVIVFVPFSAAFLGAHPDHEIPAVLYGLNLLAVILLSWVMLSYISRTQNVDHVSERTFKQARFRGFLSIASYLLGIISAFVLPELSVFFFIFPVVFNIIPGTVDLVERLFGLKF